jgi:hypothetical protein
VPSRLTLPTERDPSPRKAAKAVARRRSSVGSNGGGLPSGLARQPLVEADQAQMSVIARYEAAFEGARAMNSLNA